MFPSIEITLNEMISYGKPLRLVPTEDFMILAKLSRSVRDAQKEYFETRRSDVLIKAKHLESQLDNLLARIHLEE